MKIAGLQKTTLLDYPGYLAATVFTKGCNFACPFCQNSKLITGDYDQQIPEEEVLAFLRKRRGVLEGICISGGEPTLQPDLEDFICKVRNLGYRVKLDTNGSRPDLLLKLIDEGLIDYVAMDVKSSKESYAHVAGLITDSQKNLVDRVSESIAILLQKKIPFEFRTTLVKGLHTPDDLVSLAQWIAGADVYVLQNYEESDLVLAPQGLAPFSDQEMKELLTEVQKYIPKACIRGEVLI